MNFNPEFKPQKKFENGFSPTKKQGINKPCFYEHGVVKDVGTIFMKKNEYIYIPDLAPMVVNLVN